MQETEILAKYGLDGLIVENMHDLPYVQKVGPEILTSMTSACSQVRKVFPKDKPIGVQVLAGANKGALAVALAAELDFIRAEGFVFGHVADEGKVIHPKCLQTIGKRCSPKQFGQTKNGLVSGRLACTSSKTEILNKIGI